MGIQNQPIGVFDSGVGGLTVLKALREYLPHESFIYLGDTAHLPYGTKSAHTIRRYALQMAEILIKRGIKMLVIACNTSTAIALESWREALPGIPVIGVVEPGAIAACQTTRNGHIAVIATEGTIKQQAYEHAIHRYNTLAVIRSLACPLFVALAEEGWNNGDIAVAVATQYLTPLLQKTEGFMPDCLVLGCTHFPVLKEAICAAIGQEIHIVDSAHTTATTVATLLDAQQLNKMPSAKTNMHFMATDAPERFARIATRFLGHALSECEVELIEF